ncbi:hypothetical protein M231_00393 [Tremella mesenterica]|uniref:Major facilitator superfamily (MFS) profile domain-containing protein n=1 Tax=Tremella mesenterica TaxID=5217 RepID=A0A4Q1BW65_TREME|nr:hypothetical protein M231_00393 [Tremella mesenterica]
MAETQDERSPLLPDKKETITPLPKLQLSLICFLRVTEPIAFVVCFPFVNQMLLDLGVVSDPKKAGFYAGLIESLFSVAQLLTVYHWGRMSDSIGRKPVVIIGCLGATVSGIAFGFSRSFVAMIATRTFAGLANGNVVIVKSMLAEITDDTNKSRAFGYFPLCYSLGTIIASFIGGTLSNLGIKNPSIGKSYPWILTFPYLIPCIIASLFPLLSGILSFFLLNETLPKETKIKPISDPSISIRQEEHHASASELIKRSEVRMMLFNFGLLALQATALVGLLPLYCFTPIFDGGLGFNETGIGEALSIRAICTVFVQIFTFPWLQRKIGTIRLYKILSTMYIPCFLMLPILNILARLDQGVLVWIGLFVSLLLGSIANMAFSCNLIMVNDLAPNRHSLGAINGLAQVVASAMRAVGPGAASTLFALSVDRHALGGNLIWAVLSFVAVLGAIASLGL